MSTTPKAKFCMSELIDCYETKFAEHSHHVGDLAASIAKELKLDSTFIEALRFAACLHDIGKIAIPEKILEQASALSKTQRKIVEAHTTIGAKLLSNTANTELELAKEIVLSHHEHWDGTGYPQGLAAEQIPLSGRITAVADVFDALTSNRPYRCALPVDTAIEMICAAQGTHFDPIVVGAFLECDYFH